MIIILLIIEIGLILFYLHILNNRNDKVYCFCIDLYDLLLGELKRILNTYKDNDEFHKDKDNYNCIREKTYTLLEKHSYGKYLFSFKPLKLEKWFTKEDLEFIEYLKQYRK